MAPDVSFTHVPNHDDPELIEPGWYYRETRADEVQAGPFETFEAASAHYVENGIHRAR